ncbi:hypothetical protein [Nannocystis pusilla]|uniref:hypothetical protein n=1 Tax=Nannocystis pusilla TaxID=889268 RepID=UPI003B7B1936
MSRSIHDTHGVLQRILARTDVDPALARSWRTSCARTSGARDRSRIESGSSAGATVVLRCRSSIPTRRRC